ncbi:EF-hand domain-containing protein [Maridesulfovibrio salexigens]|uniref:Putative signal transduction protein with EFhand domain protein n=1 Tax=Maridesulfovibrio salexigens (strain ATCC 14822 / DSM 2638 / NCIMB 8403 / VKM B-1763) TaxID=526222 RepID=C6C212_MARSD|nr:EF-hand domain-containing protein [Maridesulfovibrio salexigens]ACS81213.1 putative signal transduction protein with EFhand domain protein [Maridesulfovibrio salexigens DSM 2638]
MSISGIGNSSVSGLFSGQMNQMKRPEDFDSSEDFVSSIIGDQDSDGDGQLSSSEAGFLGEIFTEIDSDGDGYLSQEEMVADLESRQQQKAMMGKMSVSMDGDPGQNLIDSLMEELDSDGDSMISAEESGLSEELFNSLDTDGDGNLSGEEIAESMRPSEGMMPPEGMGNVVSGSTAESSSSEDSEEEYDEYDYNQDGVVTLDELQKAFANGDTSLAGVVGQDSQVNQQNSEVEGQSGQSILQRMAMNAYQQQSATTSASELLGVSA